MATPMLTNSVDPHVQAHWSEQERANAALVVDFFQTLMVEHDFDATLKNHGGSAYIQHNRAIPNGIDGLVGYVKNIVKRFPDYGFDIKRVMCDGDIVVLHSHATLKAAHRGDESKGFIITDTFRIENGRLAEHWDAIQPIDFRTRLLMLVTGGTISNQSPTF